MAEGQNGIQLTHVAFLTHPKQDTHRQKFLAFATSYQSKIGTRQARRTNVLAASLSDATVYRLAGLRIASDMPLPGLAPCPNQIANGDEIVIRRARVRPSPTPVQCNGKELLLDIPGVARYLLRGANEILVDQAPTAGQGDVCGYLLGTMFSVLCHQRGITPLHASAIDVADGCVAFVGGSGAGKSTLAAALAALGHQVIADDVCFLRLGDTGEVQAWPGVVRMRLWQDSMAVLGLGGPGIERIWRGWDKYFIPVEPPQNRFDPRRLRRVYQIHAAPVGSAASVTPLHGGAAIEAVMQNVYRLSIAEHMGHKPTVFAVCAAAARDVPVFRLSRPLNFDVLPQTLELLEDHLRNV
jgi:energy-coupling factor transporter ATP-binding protein EcfA2